MKKKKIPVFNSENAENDFWEKTDSTDYIDWGESRKVNFPNLKPSVKAISIRLTESMINDLKILSNKNDIPYQSLMKIFLQEKIQEAKFKNLIGK
ncbi:MAG: BrnA antitoxin family protein [Ignavibacteriae bacterium]|nr:BrnA antitoxin family protein [Ignavibacteriota bacterium]